MPPDMRHTRPNCLPSCFPNSLPNLVVCWWSRLAPILYWEVPWPGGKGKGRQCPAKELERRGACAGLRDISIAEGRGIPHFPPMFLIWPLRPISGFPRGVHRQGRGRRLERILGGNEGTSEERVRSPKRIICFCRTCVRHKSHGIVAEERREAGIWWAQRQ